MLKLEQQTIFARVPVSRAQYRRKGNQKTDFCNNRSLDKTKQRLHIDDFPRFGVTAFS